MKRFLKDNLLHVLFLIFAGLMLILWGRLLLCEFSVTCATENLTTQEARVRCTAYYGWQVDATSETKETVYIPSEFDAVYTRYNKLQKMCGFDLLNYRGKGVVRYTYRALNFPNHADSEVFINLLVYEGKLIGGDCMTVALDGFMLPLDRRFVG